MSALKEAREAAGMTQLELGRKLGFGTRVSSPAQFISNIERGLAQLPPRHFNKAAKLLGVKPDIFVDEKLAKLERRLRKTLRCK